jgi:hypothetical protein
VQAWDDRAPVEHQSALALNETDTLHLREFERRPEAIDVESETETLDGNEP